MITLGAIPSVMLPRIWFAPPDEEILVEIVEERVEVKNDVETIVDKVLTLEVEEEDAEVALIEAVEVVEVVVDDRVLCDC